MRVSEFTYPLPPELIAQEPIEPRDSSRLLDCRDLSDHAFSDLPAMLDEGDLLVVNRTRVRRARLVGTRRDTGGSVELLLLSNAGGEWTALARPSRRLRPGLIIDVGRIEAAITQGPTDGVVAVSLTAVGDIEEAIAEVGAMPLPPYFEGELADDDRYQTLFASETASAAAPTAGLHFTSDLVDRLGGAGVTVASVHLEVGLDTFRPMVTEHIEDHQMHSERIDVDAAAVQAVTEARSRGGRVIAVGTTAARSLESAAVGDGTISETHGATDLYITPGYEFTVVDGLITNFHVPGSTLVVMVAALLGDKWREAYDTAIARRYRMLSFGDAMVAFR